MRLGILHFGGVEYNLNPGAVTDCAGVSVPGSTLDPRNLGLNPSIKPVWNLLPAGHLPTCGTPVASAAINTFRFDGPPATPRPEGFGVAPLDHRLNSSWQ